LDNGTFTTGNDRHELALTLDCRTVEANYRRANFDLLAFDGYVCETCHFLCENLVGNLFQIDDRAIERRKNMYLCRDDITLLCFQELIHAYGNII
jgi:hypothetical protein